MKKFILTFFLSVFFAVALIAGEDGNNTLFVQGNTFYAEQKYDDAIAAYEKVISNGLLSPELFFNLGNAYYKNGKNALAILNYEKAKELSPLDEDITFNLKQANSRIVDKIDALPTLFIHEWKNSFLSSFSETGWSVLCIIAFILFAFSIGLYIASGKVILKQIGFWSTLLFFAAGISFYFVAKNIYKTASEDKEAIILSSTATVKGSPSEQGTKLFILHEGAKVKIESKENNWTEIKLANGNVGWVPSSSLGAI